LGSTGSDPYGDAFSLTFDDGAEPDLDPPGARGSLARGRPRRLDFELFVLQHRLEPMVARLGREAMR